jgi:hypothetical protein
MAQPTDIIIVAKEGPGGELERALLQSPYKDRIIVCQDTRDVANAIKSDPRDGLLFMGFQGEWWTWDDIQGILSVIDQYLGQTAYNFIHWLPDNWFNPKSLVPEISNADEAYAWIEAQLA